jgi:uncharacterized membrane-anchored protein YitT (DUF2179 family)
MALVMKKTSRDILLILIGAFIFAVGVSFYIIPNGLSEGGILGLTIIIHYLFHWSPGIINLVLNIALMFVGFKFLEKRAIIYTLLTIVASSGFLFLIEDVGMQLTNDTLLASIFAGLFVGAGLGLIFRTGGTSGGSTILARMANKLFGWSIGKSMLFLDILVVGGSLFIIGLEKGMYTLLTVYIGAKVIDFTVERIDERVAVLIISNSPDTVLHNITNKMSRGLTVLDGSGGYTGNNKKILYLVINNKEILQLKKIISEVDEQAYVTLHNVSEMNRKGYKANKLA